MITPIPNSGVWGTRLQDRKSAERILCELLERTGAVACQMRLGTAWQLLIRTPHQVLRDALIQALVADDPGMMTGRDLDAVAEEMVQELVGSCGRLQPDGLHFDLTPFDFVWRIWLLAALYRILRPEDWPVIYSPYGLLNGDAVEIVVGYTAPDMDLESMERTQRQLQEYLGSFGLPFHQWGDRAGGWGVPMNRDSALSCILGAGGAVQRDQNDEPILLRLPRARRLRRYEFFKDLRNDRPDRPVIQFAYASSTTVVKNLPRYLGRFCREEGESLVVDLEKAREVITMMVGRQNTVEKSIDELIIKLGAACARMNGLRVSRNEAIVGVAPPALEIEAMRAAVAKLTAALPGYSQFSPVSL